MYLGDMGSNPAMYKQTLQVVLVLYVLICFIENLPQGNNTKISKYAHRKGKCRYNECPKDIEALSFKMLLTNMGGLMALKVECEIEYCFVRFDIRYI